MPWTTADVERFKHGLTAQQKRQWVAIANSVLAKCIKDGGSESSCAGSAIRQANGSVGPTNSQEFISTNNEEYQIRNETLDGKNYLVVPVIMMVEGVHHGNRGPLLYPLSELERFPESWNNVPVTLDHPKIEGQYVSARIPQVMQSNGIGKIFNVYIDGNKLRGEAWLDEEKMQQMAPVLLSQIRDKEVIEVSIGVFSDEEEVEGEFNGEQYTAITSNYRPDHLALLPGGTGACSVRDGCGVRTNSKEPFKKGGNLKDSEILKVFKSVKEAGYSLDDVVNNLSEGLQERLDLLRRKIDSLDTNDSIHFLQEAYDNYVVYEARMRVGGSKMYKQPYEINNGAVEFTGNAEEVYRKVEYLTVQSEENKYVFKRTKSNKEIKTMSEKKDCTPCIEKVNQLVANGHYKEDDRGWLEALEEKQLDKMIAASKPAEKEEDKKEETAPVVNSLSEEDKKILAFGKKQLQERKDKFIKGIKANTKEGTWSDTDLNVMSDETLEKLYNSVYKEEQGADYSPMGGGAPVVNTNQIDSDEEPLFYPGVEMQSAQAN